MFSYVLKEENIGKLVEFGKTKKLSHTVWAEKVEAEWKWLNDANGDLIERVMENLPKVILDLLGEPPNLETDWHVLIETVKKILLQTLKQHITNANVMQSLQDHLDALTHSSLGTAALTTQSYCTIHPTD